MVDAVLSASRALVSVAARSLAGAADEVTLPQYRALVVLASRGRQRVAALAEALGVTPATATRMCDRLVRKRLVSRAAVPSDRRQVHVVLTSHGRQLVDEVTARRRSEITAIVRDISPAQRDVLVNALQHFALAAGEALEGDWSSEWAL